MTRVEFTAKGIVNNSETPGIPIADILSVLFRNKSIEDWSFKLHEVEENEQRDS